MSSQVTLKRRPVLSAHQKQMRFFTGLSIGVCGLIALALFWYLSWSGFDIASR
jgi:hypothetical protein